ncbi:MAG TPA: hypothetical protein DCE41_36165 [Cytophagales bacterium]|nr:hypothetical protein [Cytophagales bacterium]HAA18745.1 hypothetical protein [Cytophagales bacterium]HAP63141.1 hypothetical protein [Cytophagales bacterium]
MNIVFALVVGLLVALVLLNYTLPVKVQYLESILIQAPLNKVYDAVRYQDQLMSWSAWPKETKSDCRVEGNDGTLGAKTIYLRKGKAFGYQEVIELKELEHVGFFLTSKAPFEQTTHLHFYFKSTEDSKTEVSLWFDNRLKKPSHILPYLFGIIRWTHSMHLKDLQGLKEYAEGIILDRAS